MVTIALKSEVLFAIIGVGSVFVIVCVAAAICYTCQRRNRRSKGESRGKKGDITEELPARTHSKRNARTKAEEGVPKEAVPPMEEETKIEASAPPFRVVQLPPGGLPPPSPPFAQPRFSQSARLDPQLSQQTFSTFESFYRAQGETSSSVPPSPHSPSGAWPSQPTARRTSTRAAARLTNATLADIALPPTPTKLAMTGTWTGAPQEPNHASLRTSSSSPPQRVRTRRPMADIIPPPAAGSPRSQTFQTGEVPRSPRPPNPAAVRGRPSASSALASRPRSRSVGSSTVPPPGHRELRRVGTKQVPPVARSRSAVSRSLDGGSRPVGGQPSRPLPASTSRAPRRPHTAEDQARSYFDD
ncbi:hypothetical protein GSI_08542 [Ganoderma sinense ZZ0214-1]|uniref:Uncharacterized protein n=1 Tax=Ganoderma sinense ZZ0214-1 TaxID=1077348 RepID=A0A2G8S445_9APHY|nr:hypothetical protein GSI_08542 [Ganoderma sinense ZZ0214-1]